MDFISNFIKRPMSLVLSDSPNVSISNENNRNEAAKKIENESNEIEAKEKQEQQQQQQQQPHSPINTKAASVVDADAATKSNLTLSTANVRPRLTMPNFTEAVIEQLAANSTNCESNSTDNNSERPTEHVGNSTYDNKRASRFIDLTHYDEADIPELPNNMGTELGEDPLKLTFNGGSSTYLNRDDSTLDVNYLQLPNSDIDTAVSSDNEVYAECLSYRDSELNFELPTETSYAEHYRSALNSSDSKLNGTVSLNTTVEAEVEGQLDETKTPVSQSETNMIESQNTNFEPMDVDMNSTLEMSNYSNNSTGKFDYMFGNQKMIEKEPTPEKIIEHSDVQSRENDEESFDKNEKPCQYVEEKRGSSSISENIGDNVKTNVDGSFASDDTSKICHNDAEKSLQNAVELNSDAPPSEGNHSKASFTGEQEKDTKLSLVVDSVVTANHHTSPKQSTEISSNFPVKSITEKSKFPASPTGLFEKPPTFLEPSEYTEQEEKSPEPISIQITCASPIKENSSIVHNTEQQINDIALISPTVRTENQSSPAANSTITISDQISPLSTNSTITVSDQISPLSTNNATFEGNCELSPNFESPQTPADQTNSSNSTEKRRTFNLDALSSQSQSTFDSLATNNNKSENNRRTFTFSPLRKNGNETVTLQMEADTSCNNSCNDKRRTFNVPNDDGQGEYSSELKIKMSTEEEKTKNLSCEPMDIDESFTQSANSPQQSLRQQHQTIARSLTDMKLLSTSPTNPMSMIINRPTICSATTAAAARIISKSPSLPVLRNSTFVDDCVKMPPPPPITSAATSPMLNKKRNLTIMMNNGEANRNEVLSAKEQTKSSSKDEKDIFVEKFTSSAYEEMFGSSSSSSNMNPFASSSQFSGTDQFKFGLNDDDFLSNNLILQPSDIDFLLTKGSNNEPVDRSSLLLRFDPLLGVPVPVNPTQQQQQALQKLLQKADSATGGIIGTRLVAPTGANERNCLTKTITEEKQLQNQTENNCAKTEGSQKEQQKQKQEELQNVLSKKHANMSVDVIKDINIDNDCTKSYEHTITQSDEKQANFKMDELEKKIKNEVLKTEDIEKKLKEGEQREEALIKRITEKDKTISKMNGVIEAYEKAIAELIAEKEQLTHNFDKQLTELKADRDSNYHHLTSLETTFSDLHVKYEKSKEMTLQLKSNEESLLSNIQQTMENLRMQEQRYDKMKNHAMMQLEIANKKLESMEKVHAVETTKLKAQLKKEEISRASINEQLQQKSRENEELVKICDELINGQGS